MSVVCVMLRFVRCEALSIYCQSVWGCARCSSLGRPAAHTHTHTRSSMAQQQQHSDHKNRLFMIDSSFLYASAVTFIELNVLKLPNILPPTHAPYIR